MYRESLVGAVRLDAHCDPGLLQLLFLIESAISPMSY